MTHMKYFFVSISALFLFFVSCQETMPENVVTGVGELTLAVQCADEVYSDKPMLKSASEINIDDFSIVIRKLVDEYGEELITPKVWEYTVGNFPKVHEFAPGRYDITVTSPQMSDHVNLDMASYSAYETFTIIADKVTMLEVLCKVSNMKVSVVPTANFFNQLSTYNITVTAEYDDVSTPVSVVWTEADFNAEGKTEKVAYFDVAPLSVMVSGRRKIDLSDAALEQPLEIKKVASGDHHILNVDVQLVGKLQSAISIKLDGTLNSYVTDIPVGGFEEIPIPDDDQETTETVLPSMTWAANPDFEVMTIDGELDVNIDIYAPRKIKTFVVRVSENFEQFVQVLTSVDEEAEVDPETGVKPNRKYMDLIYDQVLFQNLDDLSLVLPHGDEILGKDYVPFSLSALVPLITTVVQDDNVTFTLELTDREGNTLTQDLTFYSPKK